VSYAEGKLLSAPVSETLADGMACRTPDPMAMERIRSGVARHERLEEAFCRFQNKEQRRYHDRYWPAAMFSE